MADAEDKDQDAGADDSDRAEPSGDEKKSVTDEAEATSDDEEAVSDGEKTGTSDREKQDGSDAEEKASASKPAAKPPTSVVSAPVQKAEKKQDLRERPFGRAREMVSEMALGTWGLTGEAYGPVYHREVDRVIDRAVELGVTLFDTADVYQAGKMKEKLAERLSEEQRIITKIGTCLSEDPPRKRFDAEYLREAFDKSRERIARDVVDCVLLHNPSATALEQDETWGVMRELADEGALRYWGVSCGTAEVAEKAIDVGADVIMLPYNVFFQSCLHAVADRVAATETAVLARSVLSHGLLAGHWSRTKMFFDNDHRSKRWSKEQLQYRIHQLDAVRNLVGGEVITLRAAALRFVLENSLVTSAVLGVRSVTQLNQLIHEAGEGPPYLDEALLTELPARLDAVGVTP